MWPSFVFVFVLGLYVGLGGSMELLNCVENTEMLYFSWALFCLIGIAIGAMINSED